jgi:D-glycerate 3-kinase
MRQTTESLQATTADKSKVTTLRQTLSAPPNNRRTIVFSIDDLYLPHEKQNEIARSFPKNPLVQHRGQPSTHDIELGISLFKDISSRTKNIRVPSYDKSAFNGKGDRRPKHEWETLNREGEPPVEVVIFEGWCVGFRALSDDEVKRKWNAAKMDLASQGHAYKGRLGHVDLDSVLFINQKLSDYERITE